MVNLSNVWGFIKEFSGVFASIPALIYLTNLIILKYFKKDELVLQKDLNIQLEQEKANFNADLELIKAQYNQENEKLRSELSHQNSRLQIAYSGVYKDQVDTLSILYEKILKFEASLSDRKSDKQNMEKNIQPFNILNEFKEIYYSKGIFIPNSLDEKIMEIIGFCFKQHFSMFYIQAEQAAKNGDLAQANKLSEQEIKDTLQLQELRNAFRDEIRKILAID